MNESDDTRMLHAIKAYAVLSFGEADSWAYLLIGALADTIEKFDSCSEFYTEQKAANPEELLSVFIQEKNRLLDVAMTCSIELQKEGCKLPDSETVDNMEFLALLLVQRFYKFDCDIHIPDGGMFFDELRFQIKGETPDLKAVKSECDNYCWKLAEFAYRLSLLELDIIAHHPDWEIDAFGKHPCGPVDGRPFYAAVRQSLTKNNDQILAAFADIKTAINGFSNWSDSLPGAFTGRYADVPECFSFANAVKGALAFCPWVTYEPTQELIELFGSDSHHYVPSEFLAKARVQFIKRLNAFLHERVNSAGENKTLRRKWLEVIAEILSVTTFGQPLFEPEQANKIVALANAAQRHYWIDCRVEGPVDGSLDFTVNHAQQPTPTSATPTRQEITEKTKRLADKVNTAINRKGLHGSKKREHANQLERFEQFFEDYPGGVPGSRDSAIIAARQFWNQNKEEFETAAQSTGEEKGYASHTLLARAYCMKYGLEWIVTKQSNNE